MRQFTRLATGFVVSMLAAVPAAATDYVLTIGGGHDPHGNQVSLEKNVLYFSRVLDELLPEARHTILFADGDDPRRDLQFIDPEAELPRVDELLARVLDQTDHLTERYRDHEIDGVDGAANRENVFGWIKSTAEAVGPGDRVILYATAHGGKSEDRRKPRNSTLYLWNEEITVEDLAKELDTLPPETPVVVVMVQCYSGGFADLVFDHADVQDGASRHNRCGFYATTHSRVAAGCTPDIDEADYREYSSEFWAAILGTSRTGQTVENADVDGDGSVTFAEAHAYVLLSSDTIDIPIKTSDVWLRAFSTERPRRPEAIAARKPGDESSDDESTDGPTQITTLRPVDPLTAGDDVDRLMQAADPIDRRVIEGLSQQLELTRSDRAAETRELSQSIERERRQVRGRSRHAERRYHAARAAIEADLLSEWPELAGPWNPDARRFVAEEPEAIVALIESHPRFAEFDEREAEWGERENEQLELERRWAKCERLLHVLESVALQHNLPLAADGETASQFERLQTAEHSTLGGPRTAGSDDESR